jgi:hypothetical protein
MFRCGCAACRRAKTQRTLRLSRYYDLLSARRREQKTEAFQGALPSPGRD